MLAKGTLIITIIYDRSAAKSIYFKGNCKKENEKEKYKIIG
jgi:hypothetical protein